MVDGTREDRRIAIGEVGTVDELFTLASDAARIAADVAIQGESPWYGLPIECRRFLGAFAVAGTLSRSAAAAGVTVTRHGSWLESVPGYADAFETASAMAAELLESEARRRAMIGWLRPIYQRGQLVGYERRYSDSLLLELLAAERPDKYGKRRVDTQLTGPNGGPLQSISVDVRDLDDAALLAILGRQTAALPGGLPVDSAASDGDESA